MTKEALKLALEALEEAHYKIEHKQDVVKREQAITAIKEALAQPEQEPVVFWDGESRFVSQKTKEWDKRTGGTLGFGCDIALYTTPPQRKPLTDEEAQQTFAKHNCTISTHLAGILARAIEAKLKEKNT